MGSTRRAAYSIPSKVEVLQRPSLSTFVMDLPDGDCRPHRPSAFLYTAIRCPGRTPVARPSIVSVRPETSRFAAGTLLKTIVGGESVDEDRQPARVKPTAKTNDLLSHRMMCQRDFIDLRPTAHLRYIGFSRFLNRNQVKSRSIISLCREKHAEVHSRDNLRQHQELYGSLFKLLIFIDLNPAVIGRCGVSALLRKWADFIHSSLIIGSCRTAPRGCDDPSTRATGCKSFRQACPGSHAYQAKKSVRIC